MHTGCLDICPVRGIAYSSFQVRTTCLHAMVISTAKGRSENCSEGHSKGTDKLLGNHCDLTETCFVCIFNSFFSFSVVH